LTSSDLNFNTPGKQTFKSGWTNTTFTTILWTLKKTLLKLVQQHRPEPLCLTDEAIHEHRHTVLRLPLAHCELNPIELAWASVKGYIAKHNKNYNLKEIEELTPEGFRHTTKEMWRKFCRHVVDVENEYIKKDGILEDAVEEMTFTVGGEDSSDEEEEDMMDDNDRQSIDRALQQLEHSTSTEQSASTGEQTDTTNTVQQTDTTDQQPTTSTNPRRNLTPSLQQYDPDFLDAVLPLE